MQQSVAVEVKEEISVNFDELQHEETNLCGEVRYRVSRVDHLFYRPIHHRSQGSLSKILDHFFDVEFVVYESVSRDIFCLT